jgi:hypothetical protein
VLGRGRLGGRFERVILRCQPGLGHGSDFSSPQNLPEYLKEMVRWFDQYLQRP